MNPEWRRALALAPEFMRTEDGATKSVGELTVAKRWISRWGDRLQSSRGDYLWRYSPITKTPARLNTKGKNLLTHAPDSALTPAPLHTMMSRWWSTTVLQAEISAFFERPILNNPYDYPGRHWELDDEGRPTSKIVAARRSARFVTPIPKPRKIRGKASRQPDLGLTGDGSGADAQDYDLTSIINEVRAAVDRWRHLPQEEWRVTPESARLLNHWRSYPFGGIRPFFCQTEAVETAIWLTEVAPWTADGKRLLSYLRRVNLEANPGVGRLALKLATGAGKTMVMAMLIAWQTVNAVRHRSSIHFTRGFLIVTPGLTICELLPSASRRVEIRPTSSKVVQVFVRTPSRETSPGGEQIGSGTCQSSHNNLIFKTSR